MATRAPRYAELQVTTNFSFLRGGSHGEELVAQAKALGLAALAVTDRNTLAGIVRAHVAAKEVGLRLVVGARLDLADAPSLLCFPKDRAAYGRLCRLLSLGQGRAEKGRCTLFLADVAEHCEGSIFIALAPDDWDWRKVGSDPSHRTIVFIREVRREGSDPTRTAPAEPCSTFEQRLEQIKAALSGAPLYIAASHGYRGDDRARIAALDTIAERCATPLVVTGDVLYHAPHRRPLQDVLTCVREHTTLPEAGLSLEANAERHLKRPSEMARLFAGFEAAIARTIEIADACRFSLDELVYEYPDEPVPPGKTSQAHLADLTWEGAACRFPEGLPEKVRATIVRELELVSDLGYAPYFLTVHDIVTFARSRAILCQGRGSAANSVVCYCLGITAVNPTEVDLLFERFVSHARKEPPDIDVDFEHDRREEVIQYIYARYGRHRAGLAATVISYRARSAVRDVGKAMGLSEDTVAALAGMVWGTRSGGALPEKHVEEAGLDPRDPLLAKVLELTEELIGFPRHLSQHVGGFILTRGPLTEVVPVGNAVMADRTFIEWDKDDIAALGLMKVDVLALGMLSAIRRAFDLLAVHHDRPTTLASVPRDDPAVYDMLCKADSIGVFQVESRAQMNMLPRLRPRTFYDLVIEVAIVRPGPIQGDMVHPYLRRRAGLEEEVYPSPAPEHGPADELRQILGKTKGVPLFQEQAMRIAMVAAKFSDADVNELRKAMATFRRRGTIGLLEEKMVSRMVARGYAQDFAQRCFNQIKGFGEYGFPESHAASFAHLVYVSAWLKCHYPAAFACALLNSQPMGFYAPAQIVRCAREHGVEARAADVNLSDWDSTLEDSQEGGRPLAPEALEKIEPKMARGLTPSLQPGPALRLGLRQIDGLQKEEIGKLVKARMLPGVRPIMLEACLRHGSDTFDRSKVSDPPCRRHASGMGLTPGETGARPFRSVHDLWMRAGLKLATLEKLAAADAFRSIQAELGFAKTGLDRRQALWEVKALANAPPLPLFTWGETREAGAEPPVALPEMGLSEHVVNDYQTLRLSLKAHPMSFLRAHLRAAKILSCSDIRACRDGAFVRVAGVVLVRQRPGSAKGVVFMTLEDETGVANAVVWPKTLEKFRKVVMGARLILITGRVQRHEDIIHIVSAKLEDKSDRLAWLSEQAQDMKIPIANADEVVHPDPGSARSPAHPRWAGHPRHERIIPPNGTRIIPPRGTRIIPKSRDFH